MVKQLPTGSCVLKQRLYLRISIVTTQLPTGSCVLKQTLAMCELGLMSSYLRVAVC